MTEAIHLSLLAEPREFAMAERDKFDVGVMARNLGKETIDPELHRARLLINGRDSLQWGDAISNGVREEKWYSLPPGESVSISWGSMGAALFPDSGEYILRLRLGTFEAEPIVVRVRP